MATRRSPSSWAGWRMDVIRDPAVAAVKQAAIDTFSTMEWVE
ncbi:hypothetical protein [Cupriavidus sp. CuC1]